MAVLVKCMILVYAAVAASAFNLGEMDVSFHLFTRSNPTASQVLFPNIASLSVSSFAVNQRTVVTIHSNGQSVADNFNAFVVKAHLDAENVNVIAVEWSVGAGMYTQGLANAPQVGRRIADFFNILYRDFSYNPANVRIVGLGLGGHIAGIAARNFDVPLPHIVAIDPSLVGWTYHPERLSSSDATIVEVLHATAGLSGYDLPLGTIDFYANGGSAQPGCGSTVSCSQTFAYAFYAESIERDLTDGARFVGTKCESYDQAIVLACNGDRDVYFGGTEIKSSGSGIYTFTTNWVQPFARG